LSPKAVSIINDKKNAIFYSIISIWETAIKYFKNPAKLDVSYHDLVRFCKESRFNDLMLEFKHIDLLETLARPDDAPPHHDPFDRLLIAQAKAESMTFLTHDSSLCFYNEPCVKFV